VVATKHLSASMDLEDVVVVETMAVVEGRDDVGAMGASVRETVEVLVLLDAGAAVVVEVMETLEAQVAEDPGVMVAVVVLVFLVDPGALVAGDPSVEVAVADLEGALQKYFPVGLVVVIAELEGVVDQLDPLNPLVAFLDQVVVHSSQEADNINPTPSVSSCDKLNVS